MRQWIGSALVQIMACRPIGAKPLSKPMLGYVNWTHRNKFQWSFDQNTKLKKFKVSKIAEQQNSNTLLWSCAAVHVSKTSIFKSMILNKYIVGLFKFHWRLFLIVWVARSQHCLRKCFGALQPTGHYLNPWPRTVMPCGVTIGHKPLTHCGLAIPCDVTKFDQHWFEWWLGVGRQQIYLNQFWLIISEVFLLHSLKSIFSRT